MEEKEKINAMVLNGKINPTQAKLLQDAFEESQQRSRKSLQQVIQERKKREKNVWGYLSVWVLVVLVCAGFLLFSGTRRELGRDTYLALKDFDQASVYLEKEDYQKALEFCKKGIKKAPRFSLGYTLLGVTYKIMYDQKKDEKIKQQEIKSFQKAKDLSAVYSKRKGEDATIIFFVLVFVILVAGSISALILIFYNAIVKDEERVNETWAQVWNLYQRKLDLIPALMEAAKNYSQHEKETLENVTCSRAGAKDLIEKIGAIAVSGKQDMKELLAAQEDVSLKLGRLFALAEKYPDLKANVHFLTVQQELKETEDSIVRVKREYNISVRKYNSGIRYLPKNLVASLCGFENKEYFKEGLLKTTN